MQYPNQNQLKSIPKDGGDMWNRLVFEKSPYLLQHAANPVDWFPWGKEAFDLAVEVENLAKQYWKILLSGRVKLLSVSQMQTVLKKFKSYGKQKIDR